ncbi:MAG TPA: sigma-70 family RNA polymerase sigma factor [Edaphobacter sp.]|nr:sigma-70 family RNA polymerase sigma factor [Edaphobacter sp.]
MEKQTPTELPFRELALEYLDGLYGYAMTLTRSKTEAEDLVQETYLRAARAFDRLRPDSNLKSWLFTILRNVYLNQIRRRQSGPPIVEMEDQFSDLPDRASSSALDPLSAYLASLKRQDVHRAIESLPAVYREVIILREFEDLSYLEIAEVLNCPAGTVMSRLGRAREKLKRVLEHWRTDGGSAMGEASQNESLR